jgi:hypothetical protein
VEHNKNISFEFLSGRFGPAFAQDICDRLDNISEREINAIDILELNELAHRYWVRTKELIKIYQTAQSRDANGQSEPQKVYANWELIFMRRQIFDLRILCQMARADSRTLTEEYKRRLGGDVYQPSLPTVSVYRAAA